jgi:NAD(P)-dependent dehydrogenase (short-subunit alcohol dehydrogenase family)
MPSERQWNSEQLQDQRGRIAVVTGASSGIGMEAARILAQRNARVILAVRNVAKGKAVAESIRKQYAPADVGVRALELSSLDSIAAFADAFADEHKRLDILIDNAGVMMCPYAQTQDGFEIQFGTNHLGHFALTLQLLPLLQQTPGSRVVVVSSMAHRRGSLDFSDLNWTTRKYKTVQAYCDSKLANLYFTYELARKLKLQGNNPLVAAAHPGWTTTELQRHMGKLQFLNHIFGQGIAMGALPTLRAALDEEATLGDYYGPAKFFEQHGHPVIVKSTALSHDIDAARNLWQLSEEMTSTQYAVGALAG